MAPSIANATVRTDTASGSPLTDTPHSPPPSPQTYLRTLFQPARMTSPQISWQASN